MSSRTTLPSSPSIARNTVSRLGYAYARFSIDASGAIWLRNAPGIASDSIAPERSCAIMAGSLPSWLVGNDLRFTRPLVAFLMRANASTERTLMGCSAGRSCPYFSSNSAARAGGMMPMVANVAAVPRTKPCRVTGIGVTPSVACATRSMSAPLRPRTAGVPVARADDAACFQMPQVGGRQTELASEHFLRVGAHLGRPGPQFRCARALEARKGVVDHHLAELGIAQRRQRAARRDLRVFKDGRDRFQRPHGAAGGGQHRDDVVARARRAERVDQRVERRAVRDAVSVGAKARVADERVAADRAQHALCHFLRAARQRNVGAVAAAVRAARRRVFEPVAEPPVLGPVRRILGEL